MNREIPLLKPEDIEVKVKQISQNGALALLYKTARTDMEYLDKVFGIGNWQCDYKEIKGNLYCTIQIWDDEKSQWVAKVDCGIESREDDEGNQKKGEASDAFKRAGFKVGIGRELYSSPFIWLSVETKKDDKGRWQLADRFAKFEVAEIDYDSARKINRLRIVNAKTGDTVYEHGARSTTRQKRNSDPKPEATGDVKKADNIPPVIDVKTMFNTFCNDHGIVATELTAWRDKAASDPNTGVVAIEFKKMTNDQWLELFTKLGVLAETGYFA